MSSMYTSAQYSQTSIKVWPCLPLNTNQQSILEGQVSVLERCCLCRVPQSLGKQCFLEIFLGQFTSLMCRRNTGESQKQKFHFGKPSMGGFVPVLNSFVVDPSTLFFQSPTKITGSWIWARNTGIIISTAVSFPFAFFPLHYFPFSPSSICSFSRLHLFCWPCVSAGWTKLFINLNF